MNNGEKLPETSQPESPRKRNWQSGGLLAGLILILVGVLLLLQNFGMLQLDVARLWQLWPLLIVAAGLSLLSVRGWLNITLVVLFMTATLGLIALVTLGTIDTQSEPTTKSRTVEVANQVGSSAEAKVSIDQNAGTLSINSSDTRDLLIATLFSDFTNLTEKTRVTNGKQEISLVVDAGENKYWAGRYRNDLRITLSESSPISLSINSGAASIDADLERVNLRELRLDTGASRSEFRLGGIAKNTAVTIDAGMSSIKFWVPKRSGLQVEIESPMSSLDIPSLRKLRDGFYQSENFDAAENKITISGSIGMANLDISYY